MDSSDVDRFEFLANEIVCLLVWFLDPITYDIFCRVCKRFHQLLSPLPVKKHFFKGYCKWRWNEILEIKKSSEEWKPKNLPINKVLLDIQNIKCLTGRNWYELATCFCRDGVERPGSDYVVFGTVCTIKRPKKDTYTAIIENQLQDIISFDFVSRGVGTFVNLALGTKYHGEFMGGLGWIKLMHGYGCNLYINLNVKYEGNFFYNYPRGKGTVTYIETNESYTCNWDQELPDSDIHCQKVKDCIKNGVCLNDESVRGIPHMIYYPGTDAPICGSCLNHCLHPIDRETILDSGSRRKGWSAIGVDCECSRVRNCMTISNNHPNKI